MNVAKAKEAAKAWIEGRRETIEGFAGAYFTGSINSMQDADTWPSSSDVDFHIFVEGDPPEGFRQSKFRYHRVLLEPLYRRLEDTRTPEQVLGSHSLACHFMADNIISDPTGHLAKIQRGVRQHYRKREWVLKRCESVLGGFESFAERYGEATADDVNSLFMFIMCIGIAATLPTVADLRAPTARKCLVRMRKVACKYGRTDLYEDLLGIAGVSDVSTETAIEMHQRQIEAFDFAVKVIQTPFWLDFDVCEETRVIAADGVREMIQAGDHRETVWFLLLIHNLCLRAIINDGSEQEKRRFRVPYEQTKAELGLAAKGQVTRRMNRLREFFPKLHDFSEWIVTQNPEIVS